jgi:ATP-dependent helicase HrpB
MGREMTRYPVHPRLARLVIEAEARGVGEQGCAVAAALSAGERLPAEPAHTTRSDLLSLLAAPWQPYTARVLRQIRQAAGPFTRRSQDDDSLLLSVLAAFSDRVARRRVRDELQLAAGGPAVLSPASGVRDAALLVAVEIEDRRDQRLPLVRLASAVEPEWLLDLFPERVRETRAAEWNRAAERVEGVSALRFDSIVLEESREMPDSAEASRLLAEKALEAGAARFVDVEELETFLARVNFAAAHSTLPTLGEPHVRAALESLAQGLRSFAELESAARGGGLLRALEAQLPSGAGAVLERVAPARIRLPGGRQVRVHYKAGQPPWISSRLQDFFGLRDTPRVAGGKVPVVAHLLAPNHRPVQTTADLAGFWERLYPQVRRELARRYPKHAWPEKP